MGQVDIPFLYFTLIAGAVTGLIQLVFDFNGYEYGLLIRKKGISRAIAVLLIAPAFFVFFFWNDILPISVIHGSDQVGLFLLGAITGVAFCVIASSVINRKAIPPERFEGQGLEVLKFMTFFHALKRILHR